MDKKRLRLSARLALIAALVTFVACSTPRIVVLDDPLTAREHVDLGLSYELQGKSDLAEKEYLKAAGKEQDWATPYFNLGNIAYRNKDLAAAEKYYSKALDRDPESPDIMNNLATVLHEQGMNARAGELIEQALSIRQRDEYLDTLHRIEETGP